MTKNMEMHDYMVHAIKSTVSHTRKRTCSCMVVLSANHHGIHSLFVAVDCIRSFHTDKCTMLLDMVAEVIEILATDTSDIWHS
jgi:hypothetical protein